MDFHFLQFDVPRSVEKVMAGRAKDLDVCTVVQVHAIDPDLFSIPPDEFRKSRIVLDSFENF